MSRTQTLSTILIMILNTSPLRFQPIPYQGSKRILAPRICSFFPSRIETFYEPFAGSAAVTLYSAYHDVAEHYVIGDVCPALIKLWKTIILEPEEASLKYEMIWHEQFEKGAEHFNTIRTRYNEEGDPVDLLYLIARCVKNAIRFNRHGQFSQSQDRRRHGMKPARMRANISFASSLLKGRVSLFCGDFRDCIADCSDSDFVYMDPPYQGTTYGHDKRYAKQLERDAIVSCLRWLNKRNVPYVLSYDGHTGDKQYGSPLCEEVDVSHFLISAGVSSQGTLNGKRLETIESLYVPKHLCPDVSDCKVILGEKQKIDQLDLLLN